MSEDEARIERVARAICRQGAIAEFTASDLEAFVDDAWRLDAPLALAAIAAATAWQPIETAPTEGNCLVYLPGENRKFQVMYRNRGSRIAVIGGAFAFDMTKPTHWMPLPEPPK